MITIQQIEDALRANGGFVSYAANALGCSQPNITQRIKKSAKLRQVQADIADSLLDLSEHSLIKKIKDGDLGAICFYLKCKGKHRGYIERQEVTGLDGKSIKITVTDNDED